LEVKCHNTVIRTSLLRPRRPSSCWHPWVEEYSKVVISRLLSLADDYDVFVVVDMRRQGGGVSECA
jgi:hypothetical protein